MEESARRKHRDEQRELQRIAHRRTNATGTPRRLGRNGRLDPHGDGGAAIVRTGCRERISSYPYVPFFPESRPILEDCLPTATIVREVFESAGFSTVSAELVTQEIAADYTMYVEKLLAGGDSVLAQLSPTEFENGIDALRAHAARTGDKPVSEPIDVLVFR